MSAYACSPSVGSEPGTGFGWVIEAAKRHDVWVITRANNREKLEEIGLPDNVTPLYVDPPRALTWWKRGQRGVRSYYVLWQRAALARALEESALVRFDLVHHATFATYWLPTWMWQIGAPLVWGPVGGGEPMPQALAGTLRPLSSARERLRSRVVRAAELLGWPQATARRAARCLATSDGTADRLRDLGARRVEVFGPPVGVSPEDLKTLSQSATAAPRQARFLCVGRLQGWKGFHLAIRALAQVRQTADSAELDVVGTGPAEGELRKLAAELGVANRVRFVGWLARDELYRHLGTALALVHPSLHDPGAWVVAEALAAGTPVITHEHGGPAALVGPSWPLLVPYTDEKTSVETVTSHMKRLLADPVWASSLSKQASHKARESLTWDRQGQRMDDIYLSVARSPIDARGSRPPPSPAGR